MVDKLCHKMERSRTMWQAVPLAAAATTTNSMLVPHPRTLMVL
jgi:H+/gluconate symporter-like permease